MSTSPDCTLTPPGGVDGPGLTDYGPFWIAWAGNGPSNGPTERALTKGIWSFFQNKYKNHVKQLDSCRAVSCWKCHVELRDVGVIKGFGGFEKTTRGSGEGRHSQLVLPDCGCQIPVPQRGRGGGGSLAREGRIQLHKAHKDDTERGRFLRIQKRYISHCFSNSQRFPGQRASVLYPREDGRGSHTPLTSSGGLFPWCFALASHSLSSPHPNSSIEGHTMTFRILTETQKTDPIDYSFGLFVACVLYFPFLF